MSYRYIKVPMGINSNMIKINHLSNFALEILFKGEFNQRDFDRYKIDEKKAKIQTFKVLQTRGI